MLIQIEQRVFCILNDQSMAAAILSKKIWQKNINSRFRCSPGNGTAEIFQQNKNVFTVSFHGKNNYPFRKETSDFDYEAF